jgi:hypothetical protein
VSHYEPPDPATLNREVAHGSVLPEVLRTQVGIRTKGKRNARIRTGRMRYEIEADKPREEGTRVHGIVHSSAIDPDRPTVDYACFQEFGTRYITPNAHMRKAARAEAAERGHRYDPRPDPWPHR